MTREIEEESCDCSKFTHHPERAMITGIEEAAGQERWPLAKNEVLPKLGP